MEAVRNDDAHNSGVDGANSANVDLTELPAKKRKLN